LFTRFTLALAVCGLAAHGFSQDKPVIIVKHLEPMRYPDLARQARLQGSISIRLKISSSGNVVDAEASTADTLLKAHPLLQKETVNLVRRWTFGCANCPPKAEYEHYLIFVYRLEGQETQSNNSRFTMDSPDHVTVATNPPQVNW
jgi:TonB family protein